MGEKEGRTGQARRWRGMRADSTIAIAIATIYLRFIYSSFYSISNETVNLFIFILYWK
jgi:hypothetical protein